MRRILLFTLLFIFIFNFTVFCQNEWTVMIYMSADNDFEADSFNAFDEMEKIGSFSNGYSDVEFVVLWDRAPGYLVTNPDWQGTRIYTVKKDTQTGTINSDYIDFYPTEANMGDIETLKNFMRYCDINHNARNYALFFWNHGDGWYDSVSSSRAVCTDTTSGNDSLSTIELQDVFSSVYGILKKKIKIVGFDASMMQMIEVMSAVSMGADIMIGSQQVQPGFWPYEKVFQAFIDNYAYPEKISSEIVKAYTQKFENNSDFNVCLSAVDLNKAHDITWKIKKLQTELNNSFVKYYETFRNSSVQACRFNRNDNTDLYHFLGVLARDIKNVRLERLAVDVLLQIYDSVIENSITENNPVNTTTAPDISKAHGISVYLPFTRTAYLKDSYEKLRFSKDSGWRELLNRYHNFDNSGNSYSVAVKLKPSEVKVLRLKKKSSGHEYSDVTNELFENGYRYIFGNLPYSQYSDEYYQVYVKFDLSQLSAIKDQITVQSAELYHWSGMNWKIKEKKILGKINSAFSGKFVHSGDYTILEADMSSLDFSGTGLTSLISGYVNETETNNGIILGAGIDSIQSGYVKGFDTDKISLVVKYLYK